MSSSAKSSSPQGRYGLFNKKRLTVDLSSMIDLVFLLLFFFMISSRLVSTRHDPNVRIPIASGAVVPDDATDRLVLNIYTDGTVYDAEQNVLDSAGVVKLVESGKAINPNLRVYLRADRETLHDNVKKVIDSIAKGGVKNVIFSTEQ